MVWSLFTGISQHVAPYIKEWKTSCSQSISSISGIPSTREALKIFRSCTLIDTVVADSTQTLPHAFVFISLESTKQALGELFSFLSLDTKKEIIFNKKLLTIASITLLSMRWLHHHIPEGNNKTLLHRLSLGGAIGSFSSLIFSQNVLVGLGTGSLTGSLIHWSFSKISSQTPAFLATALALGSTFLSQLRSALNEGSFIDTIGKRYGGEEMQRAVPALTTFIGSTCLLQALSISPETSISFSVIAGFLSYKYLPQTTALILRRQLSLLAENSPLILQFLAISCASLALSRLSHS